MITNFNNISIKTQLANALKLVSAIFYQFLIFSSNDRPMKKLWKMFFISSEKLISFCRYANFCDFSPYFPHFPDWKGQIEVE